MESLESLIASIPEHRPAAGLKGRILARIAEAREASYRLHRRVFGTLTALSGAGIGAAVFFGIKEISSSAFGSYLSLIASDGGMALANWKSFSLSLLESAPLIAATLTLAAVFVFLASLKALAPYIKHVRYTLS